MTDTICPRRVGEFGPWSHEPVALDHWRDRNGFASSPAIPGATFCSHCGSLNPTTLIAGLTDGTMSVSGSDKSYKWYIHGPHRTDRGVDTTDEEWRWARSGPMLAKFYTPHLNRAQAGEFLDLWVREQDVIDLYVRPWLPALSNDAPEWWVNLS